MALEADDVVAVLEPLEDGKLVLEVHLGLGEGLVFGVELFDGHEFLGFEVAAELDPRVSVKGTLRRSRCRACGLARILRTNSFPFGS